MVLTDSPLQRFTHEYRVDAEHQPVIVVTAGVSGQVSGIRERLELLLPGREFATHLVNVGLHVHGHYIEVVNRLGQRVFRVAQQLRTTAAKTNERQSVVGQGIDVYSSNSSS